MLVIEMEYKPCVHLWNTLYFFGIIAIFISRWDTLYWFTDKQERTPNEGDGVGTPEIMASDASFRGAPKSCGLCLFLKAN